jgi:hypothetical protein
MEVVFSDVELTFLPWNYIKDLELVFEIWNKFTQSLC